MKKVFINKLSIAAISASCLLIIVIVSIFVSCNKENGVVTKDSPLNNDSVTYAQNSGMEYPMPENPITLVSDIRFIKEGESGWFDTDGKGIPVSSTSAQFLYLPNDIKNYDEYYNLIKGDDNSKYNILKITFGEDVTHFSSVPAKPIIHVEKPSQEEIDRGIKSFEIQEDDTKQMNLLNSMTSQQAQQFFNQFVNLSCDAIYQCPCLPFQYATDGCYARAHYMRKLLAESGYDCQKIFIWATSSVLQANTKANCCAKWSYHVAPLVNVTSGNSTYQKVIDPSLFNYPVNVSTWINKVTSICYGYPQATYKTAIKESKYYKRTSAGNYTQDNDYSDTYATFLQYYLRSGCDGYTKLI